MVDGDGTVVGGAGGKFNGQKFVKAGLKVKDAQESLNAKLQGDRGTVAHVMDKVNKDKRKLEDMDRQEIRARIDDMQKIVPVQNRIIENSKKLYRDESRDKFEDISRDFRRDQEVKRAKFVLDDIEHRIADCKDELQARTYDDYAKRFFEDTRWNASTYGAHQKAKDILETMQGGRYMNHKIGFREHNAMSRDYVRWRDWPKERKKLEKAGKGRDE